MSRLPDTVRRTSTAADSGEMGAGAGGHGPALGQPHRRTSRSNPTGNAAMMGRRMSMMRRPSLAMSLRTDQSHQAPPKLENSYQLGPAENERFNASRVESVTLQVLAAFLQHETYNAQQCSQLAQSLSDVIKARVKEMRFPRYKFVCHVMIGELAREGLSHTSRCLWNTSTDTFASATYRNTSLFAVANVYGLYYE